MINGIGIGIPFQRPMGGASFDPDYQAYLDKVEEEEYGTISTGLKEIQNTVFSSLKDAGLWDKIGIGRMYFNENSDIATLNIKDPDSHQASLVNSPTFIKNIGFRGNGSSSYINWNTHVSAIPNYSKDNAHVYIYIKSQGVTMPYRCDVGLFRSSPLFFVQINTVNKYCILNGASAGVASTDLVTTDNTSICNTRSVSTTENTYQNGSLVHQESVTSGNLLNHAMYDLARAVYAGGIDSASDNTVSFVCAGSNLVADEVQDLHNIIHTAVQQASVL